MFSGLTFKSLGIFRVNFCVQGKIVLLLHFFIWDVQFFLQCLLRRHLFPHCIYYWLFVHKLVEHIYEWVYFWLLYSVPLIYLSVFFFSFFFFSFFLPIPYCCDYYGLVKKFKIRKCYPSFFFSSLS